MRNNAANARLKKRLILNCPNFVTKKYRFYFVFVTRNNKNYPSFVTRKTKNCPSFITLEQYLDYFLEQYPYKNEQ